jgi:hypothetical protein
VPNRGQQSTVERDTQGEQSPALSTLANPSRVRWTSHSQRQAG